MKHIPTLLAAILVLALVAPTAMSQSISTEVRDELMQQFEGSARKMIQLSEAMPDELYSWAPAEGIMTVGHVYAHIAKYNFDYAVNNLDVSPPKGIDVEGMEELTDKASIREALLASIEFVRENLATLDEQGLTNETMLYGRTVPGWAVLVQLVAHMNEHVGQSVSYARMNSIVPPWARSAGM